MLRKTQRVLQLLADLALLRRQSHHPLLLQLPVKLVLARAQLVPSEIEEASKKHFNTACEGPTYPA